jgi:hypothetical protein
MKNNHKKKFKKKMENFEKKFIKFYISKKKKKISDKKKKKKNLKIGENKSKIPLKNPKNAKNTLKKRVLFGSKPQNEQNSAD